jgi:hypothetical protein
MNSLLKPARPGHKGYSSADRYEPGLLSSLGAKYDRFQQLETGTPETPSP